MLSLGREKLHDLKMSGWHSELIDSNERWLKKELQSRGVAATSEVYLLTLNRSGQIYFAAKQ